jgi:hypothetical protein
MEGIQTKMNDAARFDAVLKESLADGGDLEIVTKDGATESGRAGVMLTFSVQLPDGSLARAQTVVTARLFLMAALIVATKYPHEGYSADQFRSPRAG